MREHLEALKARQNADGGWGYEGGKSSWLEPTVWAALALHGDPAAERAWGLVRGWQLASGAFAASAQVREEHWATSLAVTLHCAHGTFDDQWRRAVEWLTGMKPWRPDWKFRLLNLLRPEREREMDLEVEGWPWRASTAAWVEPTAHALVALRLSAAKTGLESVESRLRDGEKLLMDRRCSDGGWNYGNKLVLGQALGSYPECTGLGLMGLCGAADADLSASVKRAQAYWEERIPPAGRAVLRMALRMNGVQFAERDLTPPERCRETVHLAWEAMGHADGQWGLLRLGGKR